MNWKKYVPDYAGLLLISGAIVIVDQISKAWVRATIPPNTVYRPELWITQYVRLIHSQNTGMALGFFKNFGAGFAMLSVVVGLFILFYYPRLPRSERLQRLALSLLLGGLAGNLVDRLARKHVTDFIWIGPLPIFNVADLGLASGIALLILDLYLHERRAAAPTTESPAASDDNGVSS